MPGFADGWTSHESSCHFIGLEEQAHSISKRVAASRVVAPVQNLHAIQYGAIGQLPRQPVGPDADGAIPIVLAPRLVVPLPQVSPVQT